MNPKVAAFTCTHSPNLPEVLHKLNCSLALSTYQAGKVVLISPATPTRLIQLPGTFLKPMGIAADAERLAVATLTEVMVFNNALPAIEPEPVSAPAGALKTLNLMAISSDVDDNLDPNGFSVIQQPTSGAVASIEVVSDTEVNLLLDYEGVTYHGTDEVTVRACDKVGACTENIVQVEVNVDAHVVVYNAVASNSNGDNRFMGITGLPSGQKVTSFTRWGDKVFETDNYENHAGGNSFQGESANGKMLASGTYFYTIEISGRPVVTGYLTLKQ